MRKHILSLAFIGVLMLSTISMAQTTAPAPQGYQEPNVGVKILDLLIVRPISAGVATITTAFCIVTSPVTLMFGVPEASARVLVEAPWRFTGARPLGDFNNYKDGGPITTVRDQ